MKTILTAVLTLALTIPAFAEIKKVCNMQKDRKGKEVKVCKDVKMHKKLDGAKVLPK